MVNVDIEKELYDDIKQSIKKHKYHSPSVKFFVQKAIYNELHKLKSSSGNGVEEFYSKLKQFIEQYPELKSKIDEVYAVELKKMKRKVLWDDKGNK